MRAGIFTLACLSIALVGCGDAEFSDGGGGGSAGGAMGGSAGTGSGGGAASGGAATGGSGGTGTGGSGTGGTGNRVNCDTSRVTCEIVTPTCAPGQTVSADPSGLCYGPCVDDQQCFGFSVGTGSCGLCPDRWVCVQTVNGTGETVTNCNPVPEACENDPTCNCVNADFACTMCRPDGDRFVLSCPSGPVP